LAAQRAIVAVDHLPAQAPAKKVDANRLAYLDELDPYYPHRDFPKLITPQWVGEKDVDCVVVLAIDDMREPKRYEAFLRPILRRLKEIDGRAALSIMTNQVDPQDAQLQAWLKEGLSLECHTWDHPCPFFAGGFAKAKQTYDRCVDLMHTIPNNKPVAFRMPCCDSLNTPSPRFWAEIFNKTTAKGNFLTIDSSVFNIFTSADPELPRDLVLDDKGQERFRRYLPADRSFVNTIEDYPYPYLIGRQCWEFPCVVPSDWEAQHLQKPNNPNTVRDLKAALDCAVVKKGVFCLVFHPHGWIRNDQVVDLIDHAVKKHGKKVKFLNFKEAQDRLTNNLLHGWELRDRPFARSGNGIYILDVNNDGYLDVVIGGTTHKGAGTLDLWAAAQGKWETTPFPADFFIWPPPLGGKGAPRRDHEVGFGIMDESLKPTMYVGAHSSTSAGKIGDFWQLGKGVKSGWEKIQTLSRLDPDSAKRLSKVFERDCRVQLRDIDGDGRCELVVNNDGHNSLFRWSEKKQSWTLLPFTLPASSVRFLDLNGDGKLDIVFSNENEYGIYLFTDMEKGWGKKVIAGKRGNKDALPMMWRNGTNNGFWVHSDHFWWSNEDTVLLKDHVDRRSLQELLAR
jgi:hypothetical protein